MSNAFALTQRGPLSAPECFLGITEQLRKPRGERGPLRYLPERPGLTRVALGPQPVAASAALIGALELPADLGARPARVRAAGITQLWARPTGLRVELLDGERARVTGSVPRSVALQVAVSDEALPLGDPIVMSFVLIDRARTVVAETPFFHFGTHDDAPRERAYAFAESRAINQALAALLAGASQESIASSPLVSRAHRALTAIAAFEDAAEPGEGAARIVHRGARVQRAQAYAIARALGPIYDCGIEPRTPAMVDEPREQPIAQALSAAALAARNLDPALLYAVASEQGMSQAVVGWHRGIADIEIPDRIDGEQVLGVTSIADDVASLQRAGYLPSWFGQAFHGDSGRPVFVPAGARSALTNSLTYTAARIARGRDHALAAVGQLAPRRDLDQRGLVFLTLLHLEGGDLALRRYLNQLGDRPILPTNREAREGAAAQQAFARTALWEQIQRTGVFEIIP